MGKSLKNKLDEANKERELGSLEKAVDMFGEVLREAGKSSPEMIHGYLGLAKTYKLMFQKKGQEGFLGKMVEAVEQATKLWEAAGEEEKLIIEEGRAEVAAMLGDWMRAAEIWQRALAERRMGVNYQGRARAHLAVALAQVGELEEALKQAKMAVDLLETNQIGNGSNEKYVWKVWRSGALMAWWQVLTKMGDMVGAEAARQKIEEILADERLAHRRRQWAERQKMN